MKQRNMTSATMTTPPILFARTVLVRSQRSAVNAYEVSAVLVLNLEQNFIYSAQLFREGFGKSHQQALASADVQLVTANRYSAADPSYPDRALEAAWGEIRANAMYKLGFTSRDEAAGSSSLVHFRDGLAGLKRRFPRYYFGMGRQALGLLGEKSDLAGVIETPRHAELLRASTGSEATTTRRLSDKDQLRTSGYKPRTKYIEPPPPPQPSLADINPDWGSW